MTPQEINQYAIKYRGFVLNEITNLEKVVDAFLCNYFTPDVEKQDELLLLVFGGLRMSFENKRGILVFLNNGKKINIESTYPKMLDEMQNLFSDRKVLAHYMVDLSEDAQKLNIGEIRFHSLNNKHELKTFSLEKMNKIENQIKNMIRILLTQI